MKIILPILTFIIGWIVCYVQMTYGVDQDGEWLSNKEFNKE
jgi:hypothetical protein